jgi:coatomer subunit beta
LVQILICQNLRNNLQHPNEYIRGVTLRFLCRIREEEILEPLIPSILACLEHRHSYVRRNAVLAINALYKLPKGELLLVDAPELIEKVTRAHNINQATWLMWPHVCPLLNRVSC